MGIFGLFKQDRQKNLTEYEIDNRGEDKLDKDFKENEDNKKGVIFIKSYENLSFDEIKEELEKIRGKIKETDKEIEKREKKEKMQDDKTGATEHGGLSSAEPKNFGVLMADELEKEFNKLKQQRESKSEIDYLFKPTSDDKAEQTGKNIGVGKDDKNIAIVDNKNTAGVKECTEDSEGAKGAAMVDKCDETSGCAVAKEGKSFADKTKGDFSGDELKNEIYTDVIKEFEDFYEKLIAEKERRFNEKLGSDFTA